MYSPTRILTALLLVAAFTAVGLSTDRVPASAQDTSKATLIPSQDNTLYYHPEGTRSNGLGEHVFVGHTNHGHERRALLAFAVADHVPEGSTVVSATLRLNLSRTHSGPQTITLHRMVAAWGEGTSKATDNVGRGVQATHRDATWLHPFFGGDRLWKTPGGDFADGASASTEVEALGQYTWGPTDEMTSDVQSWLDAPDASYGWLLLGNETEPRTTKRFDSKDHEDEAVRPVLMFEYAAPAPDPELIFVPIAERS